MDGTRSFGAGSESVKHYTPEMDEMFQFDEMQAFVTGNITDSATGNGGSFTALLGLPKNQALELLETPESAKSSPISAAGIWTDRHRGKNQPELAFSCSPTFLSNATLVERAARFSIFAAAEESPATSSDPSTSSKNSLKLKNEPADSDSIPSSSPVNSVTVPSIENQRSGKRKEGEKNKIKAPAKKSKKVEDGISENGAESKVSERLPYVHVRARRGQATDSHSLAERARREKINARMKLLQELVPGCNKISGTALVLDEIINHVQSLQRQVEFLSMRLAAVHPRLDYTLDNFLSPESGSQITGNVSGTMGVEAVSWPEIQVGEGRHPLQQQVWHVDVLPSSGWERDDNRLSVVPEASFYDPYSGNSDLVRPNQLKMEL